VVARPAIEQQGFIWVYANPDEPPLSLPYRIPYLDTPGYRSLVMDFDIVAALPDALENFLDATHTHVVHRGFVRRERDRKRVTVRVRAHDGGVEAEYVEKESQESGLITRLFGGGIDGSTDRFLLPSIAQLEHRSKGEVKFVMTMMVTPETETALRVHVVGSGRSGLLKYWQAKLIGKPLLSRVMAQDRAILLLQMANRRNHPEARYCYTKADLMMPHIMALLAETPASRSGGTDARQREVELFI
jgi:phenylpropionate dioxygenase-like ring-hydroxylating dioxygenase large terminal subunit